MKPFSFTLVQTKRIICGPGETDLRDRFSQATAAGIPHEVVLREIFDEFDIVHGSGPCGGYTIKGADLIDKWRPEFRIASMPVRSRAEAQAISHFCGDRKLH
jgi:hypothetical protein